MKIFNNEKIGFNVMKTKCFMNIKTEISQTDFQNCLYKDIPLEESVILLQGELNILSERDKWDE